MNIGNTQVTILMNDNNNLYEVIMKKEKLDAVTTYIKLELEHAIPTNRTQDELVEFLEMEMKK